MRRHAIEKGQSMLPDGYLPLQYIEGTGTQYIDTEISAPNGFAATIYMQWRTNGKGQSVLGSHKSSSPYERNLLCSSSGSIGAWELGLGNNFLRGGSFSVGVDYKCDVSTVKGDGYLYVNDVNVFRSGIAGDRFAGNIMFFVNQYGLVHGGTMAKFRLKEAYIYDHVGNLIQHLLAALRRLDSKPGLYDLNNTICSLTNTPFYINRGSNEFIYE